MTQIHAKPQELTLDAPSEMPELLAGISLNTNESLVAQIHRILFDLIVSLKLQPGQLVSEKEVAESLSASKTPVREALIRLEDSGLVQIIPKSGSYVTPIRINAFIEGCFTRLQLETGAVRQAAIRSDANSIEMLEAIMQQQSQALDAEQYQLFFTLDQAFHQAFFDIAGVKGVWQVLTRTQADVNRIRHLKRVKKIRRGPEVLLEHRKIVEAIRSKDSNAAEKALVEHIGSLESEIEKLAANPQLLAFIEQQDKNKTRRRNTRKS